MLAWYDFQIAFGYILYADKFNKIVGDEVMLIIL